MKTFLCFSFLFLLSCQSTNSQKNYKQVEVTAEKRNQHEAKGKKWMVSTQGTATTKAGIWAFEQGGNIFDAFAAVSFSISVERPHSTGIGGGGFLVFRDSQTKEILALDFRETAPAKAFEKMFLNAKGEVDGEKSITGSLSVGTPGLVAGVLEVHKKYGKLPLGVVMKPAIDLAENGFKIYPALHEALVEEKDRLSKFPSTKKIFFDSKGEVLAEGALLKQTDLARTLRKISEKGADVFYKGDIAKKIATEIKRNKGLLELSDLKKYQTKWRAPVQGSFQGYQIFSMPPPSSGGIHVIQILNILENDQRLSKGPQDPDSIHVTASAMQMAFADRAKYLGDPDFVKVPTEQLLSKSYAKALSQKINLETKINVNELPYPEYDFLKEPQHTTHFTIMDGEGNVVASTQTINGWFGSALVAEGTGIVLNNEMDDFSTKVGASNLYGAVGGKNNLVQPLKRPLSSMSPTIVMKDNQPLMAVGSPSGTRIITCVVQTLLNRLQHKLNLWESVALTRYHQQWKPDLVMIESPYFGQNTENNLMKKGHVVSHEDLGCAIQVIERTEDGELHGVSDPREEGSSSGDSLN